jgi:hypothetical protein
MGECQSILGLDTPVFTLNSDAGLSMWNSELEDAIEFTLYFPAQWTDYMDITVDHSFSEMQELGCYTLTKTKYWMSGLGGYYHETYRTPFMQAASCGASSAAVYSGLQIALQPK